MRTTGPEARKPMRALRAVRSCLSLTPGLILLAAIVGCVMVARALAGPLVAVLVLLTLYGGGMVAAFYLAHVSRPMAHPLQFTLLNNLPVEVVVARVEPAPGLPHTLQPGERVTFTKGDPMYEWVTNNPSTCQPLLLSVAGASGQPLGHLLLTGSFLSSSAGFTICLAAAAEPPYVVNGQTDVYQSCPSPYPG